jgi:hypothetical protein
MTTVEAESQLEIEFAGGSPAEELGILGPQPGFFLSGAGNRMCLSTHFLPRRFYTC